MKTITTLFLSMLAGICYASEDEKQDTPVPTEVVEIVLVCPEGSKHEGDELPEWVSTEDATNFYCNETVDETEIAE